MIFYALRRNMLTRKKNNYKAEIVNVRTLSQNDMVDLMVKRGSTMIRSDLLAAVELYNVVFGETLAEGHAVNTPLINTSWSMTGNFDDTDDRYDPNRHVIHCKIRPGLYLKQLLRKLKVEKKQASNTSPYLSLIRDALRKIALESYTAGSTIKIIGSRLKYDDQDAEQGIFLVCTDGNVIHAQDVIVNQPSQCIFIIPETIPQGEYYLEVRSRMNLNDRETKKLKIGRFEQLLIITGK